MIFGRYRNGNAEIFGQNHMRAAAGTTLICHKLHGINDEFVQDNHSSSLRGTIRGLHFQRSKPPQGKLIRVIEGEIYDVAVDIRRNSTHFGKWVGVWLASDNFRQLYIPPGFAHGFCVKSASAQVVYKCSAYYDAESDTSIRWNDSDINVEWPDCGEPIISSKDMNAEPLKNLFEKLHL